MDELDRIYEDIKKSEDYPTYYEKLSKHTVGQSRNFIFLYLLIKAVFSHSRKYGSVLLQNVSDELLEICYEIEFLLYGEAEGAWSLCVEAIREMERREKAKHSRLYLQLRSEMAERNYRIECQTPMPGDESVIGYLELP